MEVERDLLVSVLCSIYIGGSIIGGFPTFLPIFLDDVLVVFTVEVEGCV